MVYLIKFSFFDSNIEFVSDALEREQSIGLAPAFVEDGESNSGLILLRFWSLLFLSHGKYNNNLVEICSLITAKHQ